jgi:hypothetical protein
MASLHVPAAYSTELVAAMANEQSELDRIAGRYATFASDEAKGASPPYEALAFAVAGSRELLEFIAALPADKQQPNLFLAAVRHACGVPGSATHLIECVRREPELIRHVMLSRTTQTNEPGRCAVLLPLLARLPQPLALLEVGASAGLCLLPDRYGYDYGVSRIEGPKSGRSQPPVFPCDVSGPVPFPSKLPQIIWRAGLDLNPIDLRSKDQVQWLETLVWPGQEGRAGRLRSAIKIARHDPPRVVKGDLLADLASLIEEAPRNATIVLFHTAVLAYLASQHLRDAFAETARKANAVWISNETPSTFPDIAKAAPHPWPRGRFLLALNGKPLAWTGPHGESLDWFGS